MNNKGQIKVLGASLSTTTFEVVGMPEGGTIGDEVFFSAPMLGRTIWLGQPAFDLNELPGLFVEAVKAIMAQGFEIARGVVISFSVRQHDMALTDVNGRLIRPALSWQCNAATVEVEMLKAMGAEAMVGRLEPRLILPKLLWALNQDLNLAGDIGLVMTTGDFIAMQLNGFPTICSSEVASNGFMDQTSREFAVNFLNSVPGLVTDWFPKVAPSGQVIPSVNNRAFRSSEWDEVRALLPECVVVAGKGDNDAGAVGSGLVDRHTIVISAGTSGTAVRAVKQGTVTDDTVLRFEYFQDILLLSMMGDCASWYDRFVTQFAGQINHAVLDSLALVATTVYGHPYPATPDDPFENWFRSIPLGVQAATIQSSIAYHLVGHFKRVLDAALEDDEHSVRSAVLTGGLTHSKFFCDAAKVIINQTTRFKGKVFVSSRTGPLANQSACLGALITAMVGGGLYPSLEAAIKDLCPTREI